MREGFSSQLRDVLERAQSAARDQNQDFVGAEHLMLGLLANEDCEAAAVMRRHEVNVVSLRRRLEDALPRGAEPPGVDGSLPLSPKSKHAIDAALLKARAAGAGSVSTRLLLLALLEEPDTLVVQGLRDEGADLDMLRRLLSETPAAPEE